MSQPSTWEQILDYSNRANPYPFYDELRKTPVTRLPDGSYLVSTYAEIAALLHDPRVSSDIERNPAAAAMRAAAGEDGEGDGPGMTPTFLSMDPPDHDKFRRITMRQVSPTSSTTWRPAAGSTSSMTWRIRCPSR
jgi:cytochrome P450